MNQHPFLARIDQLHARHAELRGLQLRARAAVLRDTLTLIRHLRAEIRPQ